MRFETRSVWEDKDPFYKAIDDPENPCFRWRAVEIPLAVYYYHVHLVPNEIDLDTFNTEILVGDIKDVVNMLRDYPCSTVSLHTPSWLNNGEPGLYRVIALYKSVDPINKPYIAECADGKMRILGLDCGSESINPETIEKTTIWSAVK